MLPVSSGILTKGFIVSEQPNKTYRLNMEQNTINGYCDGVEAVKQAVYMILNIERFQYPIYSWNFGVEFINLIGKPVSYVYPEIKRCITEALMQDSRIKDVDDFDFENNKGKVIVRFKVNTIYGYITTEKVVNI